MNERERLQRARDKAHEKLQVAEYEFMMKDRALEAFKRAEALKVRTP